MADRRMFSKKIINSAKFLKMPVSTQALYFHLGLNADDDGVVEAYTVLKTTGATEDDLRVLMAKEFVIILNDDLVSYITDWNENNKIRADRKVDSMYKPLLLQVVPDANIKQPKPRADTKKITGSTQWTSNGQPMDSIGEDRVGKDRVIKDKVKHKYGEFNNILLTDEELEKLKQRFPKDWKDRIEKISVYVASTGKSYKSHYATLLNWAKKDEASKPQEVKPKKYKEFEPVKEVAKTGMPEEMRNKLGGMFNYE